MEIDAGLMELPDDPDLNIDSEEVRQRRAELFRNWLQDALPQALKGHVCFVDYTVFQDAKIQHPYFYLVSPTSQTIAQYKAAVERLVAGTNEEKDCFSVAYHPDFVGISTTPAAANSYAIIEVGEARAADSSAPESAAAVDEGDWASDSYLLWSKTESSWPPTTKEDLVRVCGQHTLQECLEKFRCILREMRHGISDASGRPVTVVYCLPLLVPNRSDSQVQSILPFSKIAAALFLGVSFGSTEKHTAAVKEFMRTLALLSYRTAGVIKAERDGEVTGLEQAIESFAHQIKGVANAMSTKWSVTLETWEDILRVFQDDPTASSYLKTARVLPAPQLIEAIRETLILWSQTRRIDDLYDPRPTCFRDVINRAWEFTSRIRFAQDNVSRNLGESVADITKVWGQGSMLAKPDIEGDVDVSWGDWKKIGLDSESRLCSFTRLLVAIFDNATEHGMISEPPTVNLTFSSKTKLISLRVSNTVGDIVSGNYSRLRVGMKGNDVLVYLAKQLGTQFNPPNKRRKAGDIYVVEFEKQIENERAPADAPQTGDKYVVEFEIPSFDVLFSSVHT
jgi:hypothetical protein